MKTRVENVLDNFDILRKGSDRLQVSSSINIINHFNEKLQESGEECKEIKLGIRRVVRGLGASKSNVRKGYFILLTGIVKTFQSPVVTFDDIFDAIDKELITTQGSKADNDSIKGQALAYGILIHTGKIFETTEEKIKKVIVNLGDISKKKLHLQNAIHNFVLEFIENVENFGKYWEVIKKEFLTVPKRSLHFYHLLLVLSNKYPNIVNQDELIILIGSPDVIHKDSLKLITEQLLDLQRISDVESKLYKDILTKLFQKKKLFLMFWKAYDASLASATSCRMMLGFKIFTWICDEAKDKNIVLDLLTPNFVMMLVSIREADFIERERNNTVLQLVNVINIKDSVTQDQLCQIFRKLYFYPGNFLFFSGTGCKIFAALLNNLEEDSVKIVGELFQDVIWDKSEKILSIQPNIKKPWKESQKKRVFENLPRLIAHPSVSVEWKVNMLKPAIDHAFFNKGLSATLSNAAQKCFRASLDHKFAKLTDLRSYFNGIVHYLNDKLLNSNYCAAALDNETMKAWTEMVKMVDSIKGNGKIQSNVFQVMFLILGVTMFKEKDDRKSIRENLEELHNVYKHMMENNTEEDVPHWTEVIIDLFLSLLSNKSHLYRNVISKVFIYLCSELSTDNIHQLLRVLNPENDNIMSESNVIDEESDLNDENESNDENETDDEETSGEDEDLEDEEVDDGTDYDKLRSMLRDALGNSAALTDTESIDLDNLDEEEGKRVDNRIAEAFREMKFAKLKAKSAEDKQLADFRLRVLNLLEIWLRSEPDLNLILDVLVTLIKLLEQFIKDGTQVEQQNRVRNFVTQVTSVKKWKIDEEFNFMSLIVLLEEFLVKGERTSTMYISLSPQLVECCTFILKILSRHKCQKEIHTKVLEYYKDALQDLLTKNNSIIPVGLFDAAFSLTWKGCFKLGQDIGNHISNPEVRSFNLGQAFHLLIIFFKNKRLLNQEMLEKRKDTLEQILENVKKLPNEKTSKHYTLVTQLYKAIKAVGFKVPDKINQQKRKQEETNDEKINKKPKTNQQNNKNKQEKKAIRNKNKRKEAMKLKKKSKLLRNEDTSVGLQGGIFTNVEFNSSFLNGHS